MNNVELGRKIREARLAKRMTQSDVVGTFITRNMLSQIENGTASPSIKTLEYLSKVLELPLDQLVTDDIDYESSVPPFQSTAIAEDASSYAAIDYLGILTEAKDLYRKRLYDQVISLLTDISPKDSPIYDEANSLMARANLSLADLSFDCGDFEQANLYANEAVHYAGNGIYASDELMMKAYRLAKNSQ